MLPPTDFTPTCPDCRYNLTGLPDGPCPECGNRFTFNALLADHLAHLTRRRDRDWGLAFTVGLAAMAPAAPPPLTIPMLVTSWSVALIWLSSAGAPIDRARFKLLWLLIPAGIPMLEYGTDRIGWLMPLVSVPPAVIVLWVVISNSRRRFKLGFAVGLAAALLLVSAELGIPGLRGYAAGQRWSDWDAPWPLSSRTGLNPAYQSAMTTSDCRKVACASLALACAAILPALRSLRSLTPSPPAPPP